jgi:hypothetical protein
LPYGFGDMTAKRIALALTQVVSIPLGVIVAWRAFIYWPVAGDGAV